MEEVFYSQRQISHPNTFQLSVLLSKGVHGRELCCRNQVELLLTSALTAQESGPRVGRRETMFKKRMQCRAGSQPRIRPRDHKMRTSSVNPAPVTQDLEGLRLKVQLQSCLLLQRREKYEKNVCAVHSLSNWCFPTPLKMTPNRN